MLLGTAILLWYQSLLAVCGAVHGVRGMIFLNIGDTKKATSYHSFYTQYFNTLIS
jgi:hypothetical protein